MTDRVSLADLLYRVLEGSGPDRELDAEIAVLIGGWERRWFGGDGHPSPGFYWRKGDYSWTKDGDTPPYSTASLDAAVTLVPEECGWMVMSSAAKVGVWPSHGATPALALCAAALRAGAAAHE